MRRHFVFITMIAATLGMVGCRGNEDPNLVRLNGRLEAPTMEVGPKVAGRVVEVLVREGDRVKAGDLLIKLDLGETSIAVDAARAGLESAQSRARDLEQGNRLPDIRAAEAQVTDRKAAVDLAKRELERQQFLLSRKVGTDRDVDRAKTELDRAAATLQVAQNQLDLARQGFRKYQTQQAREEVTRAQAQLRQSQTLAGESELRAPADAIVLHRLVEPGQLLGPSTSGLTLAFTARLYVRTFIPETKLGLVRQGQAAEVTVDAFPGRTFPAHITEISMDAEFTPKAVETRTERINLVYGAKADLDGGWKEPLVPGQPAEVVVHVQGQPAASTAAQPAAAPPAGAK